MSSQPQSVNNLLANIRSFLFPTTILTILRLLFRHFSQRQEVLRSFGQVQLLVSDSDVKSYKQIKDDLDDLRLLVEKSELWVYKAVKQEDKKVGNKFDCV